MNKIGIRKFIRSHLARLFEKYIGDKSVPTLHVVTCAAIVPELSTRSYE